MIEITKDSINYGEYVDKYYPKHAKNGIANKRLNQNKTLKYLFGAFFIFTIINLTLIYNFFRLLSKIS